MPRNLPRRAGWALAATAGAVALILSLAGNSGQSAADMGAADMAAANLGATDQDLVAASYAELDRLRDEKLGQLRQYLDRIQQLAAQAAGDPVLSEGLQVQVRFQQLQALQSPPAEAVAAMAALRQGLREHYFAHYLAFHDILFVSPAGDIVHTIRGESDLGHNLTAPWDDSALARRLRARPGAAYIDYDHYEPTGEPSAFFVEPVTVGGEPAGWLILQCTIGKLDRIFSRGDALGATGEVFLVNRERLMLTGSRFRAETSLLQHHLSAANIAAKFAERRGHMVITDYRGQRALTSFEVCPVLDREWLLIAKIDEDEVVTRAGRRGDVEPVLLAAAAARQPASVAAPTGLAPDVRVDMDEFHGAKPGATLLTWGVSTCTAVVIGRPGHFAYLGHASPQDRCYGSGDLDLVAQMLARIRQFEIYPSELQELRAVIVAPHADSAHGVVARLLSAGLFLSQITFVSDPGAQRADVVHDPATGTTWVHWIGPGDRERWIDAAAVPDLGALAQEAIGYAETVRRAETRGQQSPS